MKHFLAVFLHFPYFVFKNKNFQLIWTNLKANCVCVFLKVFLNIHLYFLESEHEINLSQFLESLLEQLA